jgi:hypothetical protein
MRRNTYVRLVCYDKPPQITLPLYRFAKAGRVTAVLEGRLLDDVRCRQSIRIKVDHRNGAPNLREELLNTSPVVRVEDGYAMTESRIIQVLRIPPPTPTQKPISLDVLEEKGIPRQGPRYLTESQRAALRELVAAAELTGDDTTYGGVKLRARPLISGFSGSGKSALVGHLGDVLAAKNGKQCPILKIPAGSWIIYGASKDPNTLVAIRDFLRSFAGTIQGDGMPAVSGAKAIIFLDELDKLASRRSSDGWYRSVLNEVIALADGDSRLLACGWTSADIANLRHTLLIGAGAFLDGIELAADQDKDSHLQAILDHSPVPEEVRLRFNSRIVYVEPPTERDYQQAFHRLYEDLGLPLPQREKMDAMIAEAQEAKAGMRFLEEHIGTLLIAHPHLRRSPKVAVPAAEPEKKPEKPVITRSRYERVADQLFQLMGDLEAPLAHVQVLFQLHASQFARVRGDIINPLTNVASTAANLDNDFTLLLDGMRYSLCADDKQRDKRSEDLWLAGHRVLLAVRGATVLEPAFLQEKCQLALFTEVYAHLSRVLQLVKYITSVRAEGTE